MLIVHKVKSLFDSVTDAMHKQSMRYMREGLHFASELNHSQEQIFVRLAPKLIELMAVNSELIECESSKPYIHKYLREKFGNLCNELNEELKKAGMVHTV